MCDSDDTSYQLCFVILSLLFIIFVAYFLCSFFFTSNLIEVYYSLVYWIYEEFPIQVEGRAWLND